MRRKDCDNILIRSRMSWPTYVASARRRSSLALGLLLPLGVCAAADAGSIRLWSTAVVIDDQIRLRDICEFSRFTHENERALSDIVIDEAPPPGGSRIIRIEAVRLALGESGANLAIITLRGSTECAVTRPALVAHSNSPNRPFESRISASSRSAAQPSGRDAAAPDSGHLPSRSSANPSDSDRLSLRSAVLEFFNNEMSRYAGQADLTFDRTSDQVLDLSGPGFDFRIRRRGGPQLGLVPLEVDVVSDGRALQTVPLVVQLAMRRSVVVARRAINQGASISPADVDLISMTFTRLDHLGINDSAQAIGQRAKRMIPAGAMIEADVLEQVPLVLRGQLVNVTSVSGSIRIITAGKATQEGRLGDVIRVRCVDDAHAEIDAMVTGPGEVRVGPRELKASSPRLAAGGKP